MTLISGASRQPQWLPQEDHSTDILTDNASYPWSSFTVGLELARRELEEGKALI